MSVHRSSIRVGTRGSLLARTQTEWAVSKLRAAYPDLEFETLIIETTGDKQASVPYAAVGTKGMFVKEIEQALIEDVIDVGIHSLKDMPGNAPDGLAITCVPEREEPFDAFISHECATLDELPAGSRVGTSSARRKAQIFAYRNDFEIIELRGNLDTRLRKLDERQYDAIIVACAGMHRLGLSHRITARLSQQICLPAVGQGALALETRIHDSEINAILSAINDSDSADCVTAERAVLAALGGGCSVPIAAFAELKAEQIELSALVASLDGTAVIRANVTGSRAQPVELGKLAAEKLIRQNAMTLLAANSGHAVEDVEGK